MNKNLKDNKNIPNVEETDVEDALGNFVEATEEQDSVNDKTSIDEELDVRKANIEALRKEMLAQRESGPSSIPVKDKTFKNLNVPDNFIKLNSSDLPSRGKYYYPETEIYIRAANVSEIRNWSMWESDDITVVDSKLNFILKNCCTLRDPVRGVSWKDIKDMDRLYIVLAIRDLTFPPGTNDLMINVSQDHKLPVRKENVDFIDLPENLESRYNEDERCFSIVTPEDKQLNFYIPSLGLSEWLKNYIIEKSRAKEPFDTEFCQLVPYIIKPGTVMSEPIYNKLYSNFKKMSIFEVSAISEFKDIITKSVNPTFTFEDEAGGKQTVPFSFLGGFRSLFLIQNIF